MSEPVSNRPAKPTRRRGPGRPPGTQSPEGREALLRAARQLMAEKGMPRVTAREVADRAGVQPALVNYYFGGKDELLRAVTVEVATEMRQLFDRAMQSEGGFEARLRAALKGWVAAMSQDPYGPRLLVEQVLFGEEAVLDVFAEEFGRPNLEAIASLLADGRAEGEVRDIAPDFLIPALSGICLFYFLTAPIQSRLFGTEQTPESAQRFADQAADLVLHGIGTHRDARS